MNGFIKLNVKYCGDIWYGCVNGDTMPQTSTIIDNCACVYSKINFDII